MRFIYERILKWLLEKVEIFLVLGPKKAQILSLTCAILGGTLFFYWYKRHQKLQEILEVTFLADFNNVPAGRAEKGVASFALGGLENEVKKAIEEEKLAEVVLSNIERINSKIKELKDDGLLASDSVVKLMNIDNSNKYFEGKYSKKIYIEIEDSFIHVPGFSAFNSRTGSYDSINTEVLKDLRFLVALSKTLDGFKYNISAGQANVIKAPPQSYLITHSGVIFIKSKNHTLSSINFRNIFDSDSYFPSSPLFKFTMKKDAQRMSKESSDIARIDNTTFPYIDILGNGVVVSMCEKVNTTETGLSACAFCLDIPLDISVIERRLEELMLRPYTPSILNLHHVGGYHSRFELSTNRANQISGIEKELIKDIFPDPSNIDFTQYIGRIHTKSKNGKLIFTIPTGVITPDENGHEKYEILYAEINFGSIEFFNATLAGASGGFVILFFIIVYTTLRTINIRKEVQEKSMSQVRVALTNSEIGYCKVDQNDRIVEFNRAFYRNILEFPSEKDAVTTFESKTFSSWLADGESYAVHDEIQELNKLIFLDDKFGLLTPSYIVRFKTKLDNIVCLKISSSQLPFGNEKKDRVPVTFGIVVKLPEDTKPKILEGT